MSWAPKPEKDGLREYGNGLSKRKEDTTHCIADVVNGGWSSYQCYRKRGHGPDGLWCKQHNPEAVKAREAARDARWAAEAKARAAADPWRKLEQAKKRIEAQAKAIEKLRVALNEAADMWPRPNKYDDILKETETA